MRSRSAIFDEPHHRSLELRAAEALAEGNVTTAFKLADRRCRIVPRAKPQSYLLRADASFRMGNIAAAVSDVGSALELAPDNIAANRRMLAWGSTTQRQRAAIALIRNENDFTVLRQAIEVLRGAGHRNFASVLVLEDAIEGWAAWESEASLELEVMDYASSSTTVLEPDPLHPLRHSCHAVSFRVPRPKSAKPQSILISTAGRVVYSTRTTSNEVGTTIEVRRRQTQVEPEVVTIIVPVHGDYEATRTCLDSLLSELPRSSRYYATLVDDASPDPRITRLLNELTSEPRIELLTNPQNLGFVGSVNRALCRARTGDVVLLNSDTILPAAVIDRLVAAAQSSPDIGTVTPMSNNGEFTSFPIPYKANPLGSIDDVNRIDKIAAKLNSSVVVDIPSGIGFCLYITRACLDAVGLLSEEFHRGYLEDVDFCLRARKRGFRNVCTPSAYVGHAGSKSFGEEKRSLVVRNLDLLERRYPTHRLECAAFMAADPLRIWRQAVELMTPPPIRRPRVLVTGAGVVGAVARHRACQLLPEALSILILEVRQHADGPIIRITDPGGGVPQSIQFALTSSVECDHILTYLRKVAPSRIEVLDPVNVPFVLMELVLRLEIPYDMTIVDAGLVGRHAASSLLAATRLMGDKGFGQVQSAVSRTDPESDEEWLRRWHVVSEGAERILVPDEQAAVFATDLFSERKVYRIDELGTKARRVLRHQRGEAGCHLGLLPVRRGAQEQWLMGEIARSFSEMSPDVSLTVVGATIDDLALMGFGNTHVTGAIDPHEVEHIVSVYDLHALFVCVTRPLFGHPILKGAFNSQCPVAFFDWSRGRIKPPREDLAIDPRSSLCDVVTALCGWMRKL